MLNLTGRDLFWNLLMPCAIGFTIGFWVPYLIKPTGWSILQLCAVTIPAAIFSAGFCFWMKGRSKR